MRGRLTEDQREQIARSALARYVAGESWEEIAVDHDLHPGSVRRLVVQRHEVSFRRWGQKPLAGPAEVARRREAGETLEQIAEALGCSRTAVRTALESAHGPPSSRYPKLSRRRAPTDAELVQLRELLEKCPLAPRARPGHRNTRGDEGYALALECQELVEGGVPMQTLSQAIGRGKTWVHRLLGQHDLRPQTHKGRSTSRRTRTVS